ncbi:hypothetical protein DCC85_01335 [Paenibacillus sp. CAA11]|uniref:DUF4179 domain-containing protein n=1 Tax=Paenibacillus sp. CAA11 TaxID=1532905 RepID=UPI000D334717|nr:DUF4179 domain-containing protein [Paenibacillus sp. CAA11]AWB43007.1 hypothetical protein DCC85_01335 [Paenibacillus sp. CAA11]
MNSWDRTRIKKADLKKRAGQVTSNDRAWEEALFEESLDSDFTNRVMRALEGAQIESEGEGAKRSGLMAEALTQEPTLSAVLSEPIAHALKEAADLEGASSIAVQAARQRKKERTARRKVWSGAAAIILLAGGVLLYTQPTLADMVRSLFAQGSYIDKGMEQVKDAGLVQISGVSAEDQGYTLKVNEVIADSTRLVIGIEAADAKGNPVSLEGLTSEYTIFDKQRGEHGLIPYTTSSGGNNTVQRINFTFMRPVLTDQLQVNAMINGFYMRTGEMDTKRIEGVWDLKFDVDLKKAKSLTLLTPLDQSYETPGGVKIHMQGASRTPSGGSLELTTELSAAAAKRAEDGQSGFHELEFHLEDASGNLIGEKPDTNMESQRHYELDRWSGERRWFFQFDNFAYDKQPIKFVLDGYLIREKSAETIELNTAPSASWPVHYKDDYDDFLLQKMKLEPDPEHEGKQVMVIPVSGTFSSYRFEKDQWVATDDKGQEYSVSYRGGYTMDNRTKLAQPTEDAGFHVKGLREVPKKLTLKRTVVNRLYRDAHWSFYIPQTGTSGVITE